MSRLFFALFVIQHVVGFFFMVGHQDMHHEVNILYATPFLTSIAWFALAMRAAGKR